MTGANPSQCTSFPMTRMATIAGPSNCLSPRAKCLRGFGRLPTGLCLIFPYERRGGSSSRGSQGRVRLPSAAGPAPLPRSRRQSGSHRSAAPREDRRPHGAKPRSGFDERSEQSRARRASPSIFPASSLASVNRKGTSPTFLIHPDMGVPRASPRGEPSIAEELTEPWRRSRQNAWADPSSE